MEKRSTLTAKNFRPFEAMRTCDHGLFQCSFCFSLSAALFENVACKVEHKGPKHFISRARLVEKRIKTRY